VKLPVDGLPCASLAEQFTIVVATANGDPEAGVQLTATAPSTASTAVAVKLTAVVDPVASVVMFAGSVSAGAVVSATVSVNADSPVHPSDAVACTVNGYDPTALVMPLIARDGDPAASSDRPGGSDPITANEYGPVPPAAVIVFE
jgi:hypothetical protein